VKHKGKATRAGLKIVFWTLVALVAITAIGIVAVFVGAFVAAIAGFLFGAWALFALFCLWFFRDPDPRVPLGAALVVAPGHGRVDVIDECTEPEFLAGPCRRVSIFLSLFDVHVQQAPVAGKIACVRHHAGQFLNAMQLDSAAVNENVLIGLDASEPPGGRVAVRLIAGVLARRIVPWVTVGDEVARGDRISLIQFGSRVDLYLPPGAEVQVKLGDRVRGGETVIARVG
jgi:phosphatidylserine decarboxylase